MPNALSTRGRLADRPGFGRALGGTLRERLVQPLILASVGAEDERHPIPSLPGQYLLSITEAVREARAAARAGVAGVLLFASPDRRDEDAVLAAQPDWLVPRAIRAIKDAVPDLGVATDVCVCAYTSHGQCVLFAEGRAEVAATHARLAEIAVAHAQAGADLLVPSGMLEGTVAALRAATGEAGGVEAAIASVLKFASALYAPYRSAVGIAPGGERAVPLFEIDDREAALSRARADVAAGADLVMVKPALVAHDVLLDLRRRLDAPLAAYETGGEHVLLRRAVEEGDVDDSVLREAATAARRAGADLVVSWAALEIAESLEEEAVAG